MIMSSSPVTSGNENDSQVGPDENRSQVLDIDVVPIPQPPVDHYLELEGDDGIRATLVCKSRPGAECRMVHDCQCEEYCACEPPSRMVDSGECNHANWINGNPVYLTEYERLMDELLSTGQTTLQSPNVTFTLTLGEAAS